MNESFGLGALFLSSFLAATLLPGDSEVVFAGVLARAGMGAPLGLTLIPRGGGTGYTGGAILAGLEHLDERYVKAVGYATKAKRGGRPKMVLLADIVGEDDKAVGEA